MSAGPSSSFLRLVPPAVMVSILPILAVLGALHGLPLLHLAPNRLVPGDPVYASAMSGTAIGLASVLALAGGGLLAAVRGRWGAPTGLLLVASAWVALVLGLGSAAAVLLEAKPAAARASLGSGFWVVTACLVILAGACVGRARLRGLGPLAAAAVLVALALALRGGVLDGLSLAAEYAGRRHLVAAALAEHLTLSAGAVLLAVGMAVLLSSLPWGQGLVGIVLGGIQVVPAVALLGGLVAVVSGLLRAFPALRDLGLSALGPWPAVVGIAAYLLLPLWRGIAAALRSPAPATLDAALALGLSRRQILTGVRLPLGAPVLMGALRVAVVQSLGLATLGALIGAGGLGRIVFDGMAQFAPDLILLGALPIVGLSLAAERALSALEAWCRARWRA